jgi:flavin-dependent dehydrogenase
VTLGNCRGARDVDVAVVGGGVAGLAIALALRPRQRVVLCALEGEERPAGGETLIAAADRLLRELGFLERFDDVFAPRLGSASIWKWNRIEYQDGFLDPTGAGWRLHRRKFEAHLRALALSHGVVFASSIERVERDAGGLWRLEVEGQTWRIRFLVDATGRGAALARKLGAARPIAIDNLLCRMARLPPNANVDELEGFSLVEASTQGWWHRATEPDGAVVVAFFTDADLSVARSTRNPTGFVAELRRTTQARRGIDLGLVSAERLLTLSARTQRLPRAAGKDWCAIGDAAIALDPLSSAGLFNALYLATRAAHGVEGWLDGDPARIVRYAVDVEAIWRAYLVKRRVAYGEVERYADEPFWQRRATAVDYVTGHFGNAWMKHEFRSTL